MGKKAKQKFESTGINEMGTIKKMIYSIVSKENATDILIMGDCLFYTIQWQFGENPPTLVGGGGIAVACKASYNIIT